MSIRTISRSIHFPCAAELRRFGIILWMVSGLAAIAANATDAAVTTDIGPVLEAGRATVSPELIDFDIPALPLVDALNRYASLSRHPALFPSEIVVGRISTAVHGRYAPEVALRRLLEGTGIAAQQGGPGPADAFVLKEIAPAAASTNAAPVAGGAYAGLIQAGIWRALCRDVATAPGAYRTLLRFQVAASGQIYNVQLLASTGDARRDVALLEKLRGAYIDAAPPADIVQQPITMVVLPRQSGGASCNTERTESAS